MSIQETLAAIETGAAKRLASIAKERRSFVEKIAKGSAVPPDLLVAKLAEWGCTAELFRAEVESLAKRYELRAEFDSLEERQHNLAETTAKLTAAHREYEIACAAARSKFNEIAGPLREQSAQLTAAVKRAEDAGTDLVDKNAYPQLHEKRNAAQLKLNQAQSHLAALRENLQDARTKHLPTAEKNLTWQEGTTGENWMADPKADRVKRATDRVAEIKAEIAENESVRIPEAERELAEAQAAFDAVQAAFSEP